MNATKSNPLRVTLPSESEIRLERMFDAPRELVFKTITNPQLISQWWGPAIYETIVDKMDFRVGGKWRFICRMPDGSEFAFRGEYKEIVPTEKIVQTFEFEPMAGHISTETLRLEEINGKTKLTVNVQFDSVADRDGMLNSGMEEGASETYDRLEALLQNLKANS